MCLEKLLVVLVEVGLPEGSRVMGTSRLAKEVLCNKQRMYKDNDLQMDNHQYVEMILV